MVIPTHKSVPSEDPVTEISTYLAPELKTIEGLLHEIIDSESPLVREVGEYVRLTSGKKLRPVMTLLSARAFGSPANEPPVKIAAAMEILHVASLMHDDVIDKATVRRGKPSVNARWGDDVAILMADYLFAAAFDLALDQIGPEPLRLITRVTRRMSEGEMFQIERRGRWLSSDDYLEIIRSKTASLFSACCALGGIAAGLDGETVARLTAFGLNFGMAFQITDDALDYIAEDEQWGKSVGIDLAAGKQTLPLLLTRQSATPEDRQRLDAVMGNGRDFRVIADLLARYGAIDRSLATARQYAEEAARQIQSVPVIADETAFEHLRLLTEYVVGRRF